MAEMPKGSSKEDDKNHHGAVNNSSLMGTGNGSGTSIPQKQPGSIISRTSAA
jgi:hypothetical protein